MSDSILIVIVVAALATVLFVWYFSRKKANSWVERSSATANISESSSESTRELVPMDLPLSFMNLSTTPDMSKLVEVQDVPLVSRLDSVIPNALNTVAQFANKIPKNAVLIDIPYKDLVNSKAVDGAKRAFAMGKDGIAKNANLAQIDLAKTAQLANIAAGVMNVAALVVGQQLMSEINSKLSELNEGIDGLRDIAVAELKSKILANLAMVMEMSNSQVEILENAELRQSKLNSIDEHKKSVIELLGQVNLMIESKTSNADFRIGSKGLKKYGEVVNELNDLTSWQRTLVGLLEQISKLSHALSLGVVSLEKSNAVYLQYLEVSEHVISRLNLWHEKQVEALQIDIENGRAGKGMLERLPGLVIHDLKYVKVNEELSSSILKQQSSHFTASSNQEEVFEKDVQLVLIDGKYFYSPQKLES